MSLDTQPLAIEIASINFSGNVFHLPLVINFSSSIGNVILESRLNVALILPAFIVMSESLIDSSICFVLIFDMNLYSNSASIAPCISKSANGCVMQISSLYVITFFFVNAKDVTCSIVVTVVSSPGFTISKAFLKSLTDIFILFLIIQNIQVFYLHLYHIDFWHYQNRL